MYSTNALMFLKKYANDDYLIPISNGFFVYNDDESFHLFRKVNREIEEFEIFCLFNNINEEDEYYYCISIKKDILANWVDVLVDLQNLPDSSKTG